MKKKVRKVRKDKWQALNTKEDMLQFIRKNLGAIQTGALCLTFRGCFTEYPQYKAAIYSIMFSARQFWRAELSDQDIAFLIEEVRNAV